MSARWRMAKKHIKRFLMTYCIFQVPSRGWTWVIAQAGSKVVKCSKTFCNIDFAIVENPQNHLQHQKYHSQKKLGLPEFNLAIAYDS